MDSYKSALAQYVSVLERSGAGTTRAEDRSRYQQHLASAALMFCAIQEHQSVEKLRELVAAERHSYGWDFLDGPAGKAAESAFHRFALLVEHGSPQHNK